MLYTPNIEEIEDNIKVWVVHSGKYKKRFELFSNTNKISLDMPGLVLPSNVDFSKEDIFSLILMSESLDDWHKKKSSIHT